MSGFVLLQFLTDVPVHGVAEAALFDRAPDGVILDQRVLWLLQLAAL